MNQSIGDCFSESCFRYFFHLYNSKAYKRNDTATIEVDTLEFSRLVLDGKNIRFEELPCKDQELSFEILHYKLKETVRIENFNKDTLKTLNLYDDVNGFNNAAGLWDKVSRSPRMRKRRKTEYETVSSFDSGALCRCFVMRL